MPRRHLNLLILAIISTSPLPSLSEIPEPARLRLGSFVENKKNRLVNHPKKTFTCNDGDGLYVPGQLIVKFKNIEPNASPNDNHLKARTLANRKISYKKLLLDRPLRQTTKHLKFTESRKRLGLDNLYLLTIEDTYKKYRLKGSSSPGDCNEMIDTINKLQLDSNIEYAEPNLFYKQLLLVNDPLTMTGNGTWWMGRIKLDNAWNVGAGAGVKVSVIDSGVDYTHPDLAANISFKGPDLVDDDDDPFDENSHGTHVAGLIGAAGNNNRGSAGVAYQSTIVPVRISDAAGVSTDADMITAIGSSIYNEDDIINLSIGTSIYNQSAADTLEAAFDSGIVVIASAGNCGGGTEINPACRTTNPVMYPAAYEHVLSVASSEKDDSLSDFSEYGSLVDVAAPGRGISSTYSRQACSTYTTTGDCLIVDYLDTPLYGYAKSTGTSMAAPIVSGLAALLRGYSEEFTVDDILEIISLTTDALSGDHTIANGRINATTALSFAVLVKANKAIDRDFDGIYTDSELLNFAWILHKTSKQYFEYLDVNNDGLNDNSDLASIDDLVIQTLGEAYSDTFLEYVAIANAVDIHYDGIVTKTERTHFKTKIHRLIKRDRYYTLYDINTDGVLNSIDLAKITSAFYQLGIRL